MTTTAQAMPASAPSSTRAPATIHFDWGFVLIAAFFAAGSFVDGWAHSHGQVDDTFFTPWHAILYSGFTLVTLALLGKVLQNRRAGYSGLAAIPTGYEYVLVGVFVFAAGGVGDLIWHTLFGIEVGVEALLSPTHLLLAAGGVLIISGPMRAAWSRLSRTRDEARGWQALGPIILSATLVLSVLTFFTQFAHPISQPAAQQVMAIDRGRFSDLYVMNADGTAQTRLTAGPDIDARYGAWSPDGRQIVFARSEVKETTNPESALYLMNADGSGLKQLTDMPGQESMPAWSPDGRRIAFVGGTGELQTIYTIDVDGSNLRQLTDAGAPAYTPAWSPDSARLLYTSNVDGSGQLYLMNADGRNRVQLTSEGSHNWGAAWSPDGNQIAFNSGREGSLDIYVLNADGSGEKRLTDTLAEDYSPTWSPDGRQIAFVSWRDAQVDIYVMNADGDDVHNLTHSHTLEMSFPKWSPDGNTILFSARGYSTLPSHNQMQIIVIASILLQSALLMGTALMLVRAWTLPPGALTLMFTLNGLLMSVIDDQYVLALSMLGAGLFADSWLGWLKPSAGRRGHFWLFAFSVPVLLYGLYFLALQLTQGIGWTIHLWLGSIFMAGIIGLLVSFLMLPPWISVRDNAV